MIMFLSMIPLYDYDYAGSNPLQLVLLLANFQDFMCSGLFYFWIAFSFVNFDGFFAFPLLFPTP